MANLNFPDDADLKEGDVYTPPSGRVYTYNGNNSWSIQSSAGGGGTGGGGGLGSSGVDINIAADEPTIMCNGSVDWGSGLDSESYFSADGWSMMKHKRKYSAPEVTVNVSASYVSLIGFGAGKITIKKSAGSAAVSPSVIDLSGSTPMDQLQIIPSSFNLASPLKLIMPKYGGLFRITTLGSGSGYLEWKPTQTTLFITDIDWSTFTIDKSAPDFYADSQAKSGNFGIKLYYLKVPVSTIDAGMDKMYNELKEYVDAGGTLGKIFIELDPDGATVPSQHAKDMAAAILGLQNITGNQTCHIKIGSNFFS